VSPYLTHKARVGTIVGLGGVEGDFTLPDETPEKLLFISAGSGITPIMSMLRSLDHHDEMNDVVLIHSAKDEDDVIFGDQLRELEKKHDGFKLHEQHTGSMGRFDPAKHFDEICPDWKERVTFLSGPEGMLDAVEEHFDEHDCCDQLHMERFQPKLGGGEEGEGGTIKFLESDCETEADGSTPILVAGEEAGLELPYGCREGICHTCVGELCSGKLRDLRNGKVYGNEGENIRTCISAPEGPVEIAL
jgi:ferredoxin-NADP reductase